MYDRATLIGGNKTVAEIRDRPGLNDVVGGFRKLSGRAAYWNISMDLRRRTRTGLRGTASSLLLPVNKIYRVTVKVVS